MTDDRSHDPLGAWLRRGDPAGDGREPTGAERDALRRQVMAAVPDRAAGWRWAPAVALGATAAVALVVSLTLLRAWGPEEPRSFVELAPNDAAGELRTPSETARDPRRAPESGAPGAASADREIESGTTTPRDSGGDAAHGGAPAEWVEPPRAPTAGENGRPAAIVARAPDPQSAESAVGKIPVESPTPSPETVVAAAPSTAGAEPAISDSSAGGTPASTGSAEPAPTGRRQQLQFATARGTRIIWVLASDAAP